MKVSHADALVIQLALITKALSITMAKRADYSSDSDPYENFREGNDMAEIKHAWQYAVRRNMEKFTRRKNIMRFGHGFAKSTDDAFIDAAVDSINLVHIEFALQLEEIAGGLDILLDMRSMIGNLPILVQAFMKRIEAAESAVGNTSAATFTYVKAADDSVLQGPMQDGD